MGRGRLDSASASFFIDPHPSQLRSAPRSEGLTAFLTFAATPSPFLALRAEGGRKLSDAEGRPAKCRARIYTAVRPWRLLQPPFDLAHFAF